MSLTSTVTLRWGGEERKFRLGIGELRDLQEKTGCGPQKLLRRLHEGDWHVDDIRETLRLGLVGAGMSPDRALPLVVRHVDKAPLLGNVQPAIDVLAAVLVPFAESKLPGKPGAAGPTTVASTSPPSTDLAPSSASPRKPSTG